MFRLSLEGRFVLDIIRTILQTAVAAGVPAHDYLVEVLRADADEIEHSKNRRQVIVRATGDLDGDGVKCSAARAHQSCSPASGNNVWKRPSGRGCVVGSSAALGLSGTEQHLEAPQ